MGTQKWNWNPVNDWLPIWRPESWLLSCLDHIAVMLVFGSPYNVTTQISVAFLLIPFLKIFSPLFFPDYSSGDYFATPPCHMHCIHFTASMAVCINCNFPSPWKRICAAERMEKVKWPIFVKTLCFFFFLITQSQGLKHFFFPLTCFLLLTKEEYSVKS